MGNMNYLHNSFVKHISLLYYFHSINNIHPAKTGVIIIENFKSIRGA